MNPTQERIAEYLERHIDNSESECKEFADEICELFAPAIADVVEKNAKLEASCAAMRDALKEGISMFRYIDDSEHLYGFKGLRESCRRDAELFEQALSTTAGQSLLDRLQATEKYKDKLQSVLVNLVPCSRCGPMIEKLMEKEGLQSKSQP